MSNFRKYDIIEFDENDKVVVLASYMYDGVEYLYVNKILPDESDMTDKYDILMVDCSDATLVTVRDAELLQILRPHFEELILQDN